MKKSLKSLEMLSLTIIEMKMLKGGCNCDSASCQCHQQAISDPSGYQAPARESRNAVDGLK